ncbi:hypothetical protein [Solwaraspora sp. WMMD792]|uniref:hypothetical protein n=1 Tax=Solwaraspora sp. WMMD792 TaxID=3016099 RepID=UPI0024168126|nr:hypothetical protein [Solwaraspora sp. WMMD792]MDG4770947.1 hypothetical protein [Solwaraspora sp. WMMD792]
MRRSEAEGGIVPYLARPGRRAAVVTDLAQLRGPVSGVVELPHRLHWQPDRRVNLDNPALLRWMYETVLVEAATPVELVTWLHGPTLVRLWLDLWVPRGVRQAWEQRHPQLRSAHQPAAA